MIAPPPASPENAAALHAALRALHNALSAFLPRPRQPMLAECNRLLGLIDAMDRKAQPIGAELALLLLHLSDQVRDCLIASPPADMRGLAAIQAALARTVCENNALIASQRKAGAQG